MEGNFLFNAMENDTIQSKHPNMFKNGTYKFHQHNKLVMSMPFEFIDGLKEKAWTAIGKIWLQKLSKHLKHAQSTTIMQIRLIRHTGRDDFHNK
jgi:hypothetical protein